MPADRDELTTADAARLDWIEARRADVYHADGGDREVSVLVPTFAPSGRQTFKKYDAETVRAAIDAAMADREPTNT